MKRVLSVFSIALLLMITPTLSEARGPRSSQSQRQNGGGQCQVEAQPNCQNQGGQRLRLRDGSCNNSQCQRWNNQRGAQQGNRWGQGKSRGQGRGGRWQQLN